MSSGPDAPRPAPGRPAPGPAERPARSPAGLLDTLRVGVVMLDPHGRVVLWSPLAQEMLGWRGEHIVGRPFASVVGSGGEGPRADVERVLAELRRDGRWDGVLPLVHRDGRTVMADVRASLLVDGDGNPLILVSLAKAHLLRGLEHDLAVIDAVFDTSALGIAVFDTDLCYVRVNQALARMGGRRREDYVGHTVTEMLPGPTGEKLASMQREVLATGRTVVDLLVASPDGTGFRSASLSRIVDRHGRVLGISVVVMDVSDRFAASAKVERARSRLTVLGDVGGMLSELMDIDRRAVTLAEALVPGFCDYSGVLIAEDVMKDGELPREPLPPLTPLVLAGVATAPGHGEMAALLRRGMTMSFPEGSPLSDVLAGGPAWFAETPADIRGGTHTGSREPRVAIALRLGVGSLLTVPLRARGLVLGMLVVGRSVERVPFDADDLALAYELADRAGAALDNARLYAREREGALMLQRALLPQTVPELTGMEVANRYVPGGSGAEAGGDWFDVVPLAGGRVAFVIGDVMGHGLSAAATMGRLRTAVRTLAGLDMTPDELLRRVNDLSDDFALSPEEPMMATCVYAVYDPASRKCVIARAGHLPPLLITPGGRVAPLDLPANAPIGVAGTRFESVETVIPEGSVLALYTDGLIERRREDITDGIERLIAILRRPYDSLEEACDGMLTAMVADREPDDVAVLMARLGGLPEGSAAAWSLPADAVSVALAREHVRETLAAWRLHPLTDTTTLLVSELVTNAVRHARGPVGVRMVRGQSLLVEVSDPLPDPPQARTAAEDDEGGRGLQLVARSARRWGTRFGARGKTVWFELTLPGN